jgi:hypothetical protein
MDHIKVGASEVGCMVGGELIYIDKSSMARLCEDSSGPSGSLKAGNFFIN